MCYPHARFTVVPLGSPISPPGNFVLVEFGACGHDEMIAASTLTNGLKLGPDERITELVHRLRCRACDAKGRAVISIR
jgi:hypothetical protein